MLDGFADFYTSGTQTSEDVHLSPVLPRQQRWNTRIFIKIMINNVTKISNNEVSWWMPKELNGLESLKNHQKQCYHVEGLHFSNFLKTDTNQCYHFYHISKKSDHWNQKTEKVKIQETRRKQGCHTYNEKISKVDTNLHSFNVTMLPKKPSV